MDRAELRQVLEEIFEERSRVDAATHGVHHAWIETRIEAERARRDLFLKLGIAVAQWSVLGLLGLLGSFVVSHWRWPS